MSDETPQEAPQEGPIQAPMHVVPPKDPELLKLWQEYLQKCCEAGQIKFQLDQLDSQRRKMEKQLEVCERSVKSVASKHDQLKKKIMAEPAKEEPKVELVQ